MTVFNCTVFDCKTITRHDKLKEKNLSLTSSSDLVWLSSEFWESSFVDISTMDGVKLVLGLLELIEGSVPLWVHASLVIPSFFFSA